MPEALERLLDDLAVALLQPDVPRFSACDQAVRHWFERESLGHTAEDRAEWARFAHERYAQLLAGLQNERDAQATRMRQKMHAMRSLLQGRYA